MNSYETTRQRYRPANIKVLLIAESPPPSAEKASSRHFYRTDQVRRDDRLFVNTVKALYPEAADKTGAQLEPDKEQWLHRFQADGWYMLEALEQSQPHEATKEQRQELIRKSLPRLQARVRELAEKNTKIILIKSNVFEVAAGPLRQAGYTVLNTELVDYPGRFNQRAYRQKLAKLAGILGN
ncbi:MAG TPA: hypothetical protein VK674_05455 [Candidatus Limnocylindria bacterium]|nr:hypothetical protein [Candidatus Limnocylindria bacterium]